MRIFVLCTGRCGSVTFAKACGHATNVTTRHESRITRVGEERLDYPDNHIEVDNRLSWMLGRVGERFGDSARYVHLTRNAADTAASYNRRWDHPLGIVGAYRNGILCGARKTDGYKVSLDLIDTVNANIRGFLATRRHTLVVRMEMWREDFPRFWTWANLEGDMSAGLREWETIHNASA